MATRKIQTISNIKNKPLLSSQKFLDSDFIVTEGNKIILSVAVITELTIQYTRNGADYISLNSDDTQKADGGYRYQIDVFAGDLFNLRIKETTATILRSLTAELYLEV